MKIRIKEFLSLTTIMITSLTYAQLGSSYHESDISFTGINYTFNDRVISELRIGSEMEEIVAMYILTKNSELTDVYIGIGSNGNFDDLITPFGVNIYPLSEKNFGFQIELAYLSNEGIMRASGGIRYRFRKK